MSRHDLEIPPAAAEASAYGLEVHMGTIPTGGRTGRICRDGKDMRMS